MLPQNAIIGYGLLGSTLCLALFVLYIATDVVIFNYGLGFFLFVGTNFIHGFFQARGRRAPRSRTPGMRACA